MGETRTGRRAAAAAMLLLLLLGGPAVAAEILRADGRRETVADLRQDSKGAWVATMEGRRVGLRPGDVVAVVDDAGKETVILPLLSDDAVAPAAKDALARLADPKNEAWRTETESLGAKPSRGVHDALVAMAADRNAAVRVRAIWALVRLRTAESVAAAAKAVVEEKDRKLRFEGASALATVAAIFVRADTAASLRAGLADKDPSVRVAFAGVAPPEDETALKVLRTDGLAHADHHFRESAAFQLGQRGDASGEKILVQMLARRRIPGFDAGDEDAAVRATVKEHVDVCRILGKLRTSVGRSALEAAKKSPHAEVREAAEKALEGGW